MMSTEPRLRIALVKGIVKDVRTYNGITKKGYAYTRTVIYVGTYEFAFFNLKEGILRDDMEVEFVYVHKGRYNNAITHTLKILREKIGTVGTTPAEFTPISQQLFWNEY